WRLHIFTTVGVGTWISQWLTSRPGVPHRRVEKQFAWPPGTFRTSKPSRSPSRPTAPPKADPAALFDVYHWPSCERIHWEIRNLSLSHGGGRWPRKQRQRCKGQSRKSP